MQLIKSHNAYIFAKKSLSATFWNQRLDKIESIHTLDTIEEVILLLTSQYHLNSEQTDNIRTVYKEESIAFYRLFGNTHDNFKIEKIYLNLENTKGQLIYWKDWDFIFQKVKDTYLLWVYIGGHADLQREIKLSTFDIAEFKRIGETHIDYLVDTLKTTKSSSVYEQAKKDNRVLR
ncbi:hypothetical protein [Olleya sp. HaHaR_3_96]|uniref:hypothetical protein n=1 Tax=Olleya sp. HaHaR_3_96 TaxID=2745560 RepID=UPI001C4E8BC2|nr:hypothetical protein [Olleya sp. HaHaR_3_96]QXP58463.1 hypothetical protein H0I26_11080 [Olleya sp. HaHaR_3_96]